MVQHADSELVHQPKGGVGVIEVVVGVEDGVDGPEDVFDTFDGPQASWVTEPSGVLVVFESPEKLWVAYAPGQWMKVRSS